MRCAHVHGVEQTKCNSYVLFNRGHVYYHPHTLHYNNHPRVRGRAGLAVLVGKWSNLPMATGQ